MSETMRDRYEHDNVEFDLPVENICQELCEEIDSLRTDNDRLRELLEDFQATLDHPTMSSLTKCMRIAVALANERQALAGKKEG